jgi:quercetin dioxygenase-like cupin family protein
MTESRAGVVVPPGTGAELGPGLPTVKAGPPGSAQIGLLESQLPPGGGFRVPHWHDDLDEVFYVLEGEVEYLLDGQWRRVPAGTTVFIPAGTIHAFRNESGRPARHLLLVPPGAVEMIAELGRHPREQWEQVHARHRSYYAHSQPGEQRE